MYFKMRSDVIFRKYSSFGYITDNRNFSYAKIEGEPIGDKILSESGAILFSALSRKPQTFSDLVKKISQRIKDVNLEIIKKDAKDFYCMLDQEGFVVSGETYQICNNNDFKFSYKKTVKSGDSNKSNIISMAEYRENSTQEFFAEFFNHKAQLTNLQIEITSKCNERCVHCYIPHQNKVITMESELFYTILEQCKDMNVLHLTLSGGEPMLHKDFCSFLKKCEEYNFSINVLSNLTLLDDKILQLMKMNPLLGVQVSLYSMNSKIHDEITQIQGSFTKTINAILKLIENDIPVQISCPIMKQNKDCYEEVIKWANKHNIKVGSDYVIIAKYDHTTQNLENRLSIDEVKDIIRELVLNDSKYLAQMLEDAENKKHNQLNDPICSVCYSSVCISEDGNVYPCAGWQDYVLGNTKETSLQEIWRYSKKVQFLRGLQNKNFPKCVHCAQKDFCTMCMVRNANEDPKGDPLVVNEFFCEVAKAKKELTLEMRKE